MFAELKHGIETYAMLSRGVSLPSKINTPVGFVPFTLIIQVSQLHLHHHYQRWMVSENDTECQRTDFGTLFWIIFCRG